VSVLSGLRLARVNALKLRIAESKKGPLMMAAAVSP